MGDVDRYGDGVICDSIGDVDRTLQYTDRRSDRIFIFIQDRLGLGGIEVLELKLVEEMKRRGHRVLVTGRSGDMLDALSSGVERVEHVGYTSLIRKLKKMIKPEGEFGDIVLISLHPWALMVCRMLFTELSRSGWGSISSFHLVTHARAFFNETKFPLKNLLVRWGFFSAPVRSTYFMNEASRLSHEAYWNTPLHGYPVLRLPSAFLKQSWRSPSRGQLRVISVGRFVAFKGYNRAAPRVVRELRDAGIDVIWDIWGYGPDENLLESLIKEYDVGQFVSLKGALPYETYEEAVLSYDVFVGMGTALLEAAGLGVPSITAIESADDFCYGFFGESPSDSVGDVVPGVEQISIRDKLIQFCNFSIEDRARVSQMCVDAVRSKSSGTEEFVDQIEKAEEWPRPSGGDQLVGRLLGVIVLLQDGYRTLVRRFARPRGSYSIG